MPIQCVRCRTNLGTIAAGSRLRVGTAHVCARCAKLVAAEAFGKNNAPVHDDFAETIGRFGDIFGRGRR